MKYHISDRLQDFELEDSSFSLISWSNDVLIVSVRHLIIHKDATPEKTNCDMEIDKAHITFRDFRIYEFEPSRTWETDANGNSVTKDPLVIYTEDTARYMFERELNNSFSIMHFSHENGKYEIGASGIDPYFSVRFSFASVDIEWDSYRKKAYYELHRQHNKQITLSTPNGTIITNATIICHEEAVYSDCGKKTEEPSVSVGIDYDGKSFWGHGTTHLWKDAFAELQKILPDNVRIKCCLTCRKSNQCFSSENNSENTNELHSYTDICSAFEFDK